MGKINLAKLSACCCVCWCCIATTHTRIYSFFHRIITLKSRERVTTNNKHNRCQNKVSRNPGGALTSFAWNSLWELHDCHCQQKCLFSFTFTLPIGAWHPVTLGSSMAASLALNTNNLGANSLQNVSMIVNRKQRTVHFLSINRKYVTHLRTSKTGTKPFTIILFHRLNLHSRRAHRNRRRLLCA